MDTTGPSTDLSDFSALDEIEVHINGVWLPATVIGPRMGEVLVMLRYPLRHECRYFHRGDQARWPRPTDGERADVLGQCMAVALVGCSVVLAIVAVLA